MRSATRIAAWFFPAVLTACSSGGGGAGDDGSAPDAEVLDGPGDWRPDDAVPPDGPDADADVPVDPPGDIPIDEADAPDEDGPPPGEIVLGLSTRGFTFNGVETFLLAVSYYGGCAASSETVLSDLGRLAGLGFNNLRVWVVWTSPPSLEASVVRSDGSLDGGALSRLTHLVETAQDDGMTVDVTFSYGMEGASDGGFDAYRTAMSSLTTELLPYRNLFFDLGNERDVGDSRYLSPEEVRDLAVAVRAVDPGRLVTASLGGNPPDAAASKYIELYTVAAIDFATPHFERNDVWAAATAERFTTMRTLLVEAGWDRPIYLQEEARRGYGGAEWPKSDFLTAVAGAAAAGAAGWCFHTDAGFDLGSSSFFDNLDEVELDTIDELAAAAGM
jgi:hypothetical protein